NVNSMASNLTAQVRNIAEVTTAVARGDLGRKITVDVAGEILELKNTINTMVDQLNGFASEVTRVAREVGTEGKLGGQAQVKGVAGTWKDLTDNVNYMASNLTDQVRGIAKVVTAVARGDLTRKLALEARGEIAELAETINGMTRTLATFAEQVTTVAREVGVEGKLGGQAHVPGTAGTWRDLVDNVNQLAGNLTTQVRAIGDVARSVTKGDLTRSIDVEALGEVAALKDNINEMIRALRETTKKTTEQDWLKTNLARFTRMLQGQRDLVTVARQVLSELIPLVSAQFGVLYIADHDRPGETVLKLLASYAGDSAPPRFRLGEGLVGQCAFEKRKIVIENMPASYIEIRSGLGAAAPQTLIVLPVLFEGQVNAVIELASFGRFSEIHMTFLDQLMESIGIVVNPISASMRTEALLQQSQSLTTELRKTNEQLEEKATLLELKNNEVELAKREVEDKAEQLTLTSKYKSQFLANMSHELRTPLNSLLILSRMLTDNVEGNLTQKQVEFSRAIHSAGTDLLALITDILDLSKIESGTISVEVEEVQFVDLRDYVEQSFRHVALQKSLGFAIELAPNLPRSMSTDAKRLQQVLKNLLSNAFKFTERGQVTLRIELVNSGWSRGIPTLDRPERAIAFTVEDTGIGIAENKQQIIFDAFQQADGTTSRKYGGTGLGLSISRELTRLLGGDIQVHSQLGQGATFTLYVPLTPTDVIPAVRRPDTNPPAMALALERAKTHEVIEVPNEVHVLVVGDAADLRAMIEAGRRRGFRAITSGPAQAVAMCQVTNPTSVYVDLDLPNGEGWLVIDELCNDSATRHLPIFVRCDASNASHARGLGAVEVVNGLDSVLDSLQQGRRLIPSYVGLVAHDDVLNVVAADLPTVVELRRLDTIDDVHAASSDPACGCIVVDLANAGAIAAMSPRVPVVAWADPARPTSQREIVRMFSDPALVHPVYSRGGLLAATTRYMHVRGTSMAFTLRGELERFLSTASLTGTRVAVVDDDVRNIFAITCALESHGATVLHADGGHDAIALVEREPDIDLVLMDVMMPELDGYEVMRRIRAQERFHSLPIVALTARAMKADRDKCLTAGATDYVAKPVNTQRLVSAIRVWRRP
ncbi:MAG: response regulator, partial [Kofleriaceae bacterium]